MNQSFEINRSVGERLLNESPELLVSIDVEGDGPAGYGSLASIGAVAVTGEEFYAELTPQATTWLPECRDFLEGVGLAREYLIDHGQRIDEVGLAMRLWVDELVYHYHKTPVAVMFNAGYDWAHIDLMFALAAARHPEAFPPSGVDRQPRHNPFGIAPLDSKSLALVLDTSRWIWENTKRQKLPICVVPEIAVTHHALDDARRQLQQFYAIVGKLYLQSVHRT